MKSKSNYLMAGLLLMQLGLVEAEAACQITPENSIAYPGQHVQLQFSCDAGEVFSAVSWNATQEGASTTAELTGDLSVPNVTADKIVFNLPVSSLGDVTSAAKVYLLNFEGTKVPSGTVASTNPARLILTPAAEVTLEVAKTGTGTVVSGPSGIDCGATCSDTFPLNSQVMLNATPGSNAFFTGWTGDCVGTGNCQVNMTGAKAVMATFGAIENGQCGSAGGTPRTTAPTTNLCSDGSTPSVSSSVSEYSWTCAGTPGLGSSASCSAARQYTVTVDATTNGSLTPNTPQAVTYGATKNFTITPTATYSATLDAASTCGGQVAAGGLSYTTGAITQNCSVKMNFTNAPTCGTANAVLATAAPSGGALCAVGTASAVTNATSTYTWSCAVTGQTSSQCSAPKGYNVTIGTISGGTISPNTTQTVAHGGTQQFTLTPTTAGHVVTMGGTCGNLTSTANGNGTYTYTTAALGNSCEVTASFSDLLNGCPVPASNVILVNTSIPTTAFSRTDYSTVAPEKVYSYKFKSKPAGALASGSATATKMTTGITSKRVMISTCPGDTAPVSSKCSVYSTESARVGYYVNAPASTSYCWLQPDTYYYMNVFSKVNATDAGYNCGNANSPATASTQCAFSFTAN